MNGRRHQSLVDDIATLSGARWLAIMAAVVVAFLLLSLLPWRAPPLNFIPALLFTGLPLLAYVAASGWRRPMILRGIGPGGVAVGVGFAVLTLLCSFAAGLALSKIMPLSPNAVVESLQSQGMADLALLLARSLIQLIGEELVTILPLLAVLWVCTRRLGMKARRAMVVAVIVSTAWFAALHLPTYDWNIVQCFGTIGVARLVLTLAFLVTRSLWVSSIAHILNDWSLFLIAFVGGHAPIGFGE